MKTGFQYDLTYLTLDRSKWQDIHILNQEKNVKLVMNRDTVLEVSYEKSIGQILGTSIEFHGSGSVDNILLKADGVPVFEGEGF
ncbi:hypothetical protein JCM21142_93764 [Saccharicrinis fermentans DSM 9555 = JCM 21142]|uniref:Uncharacterized protein n=2 Tax=Saccharicrinis fermentans TaxID=982 RepID=W7YKK1_9BACT|nr:hypothetical protein JCM21142_93764 [Saccharicrinis fermentans DSM 9555 = JCM 21142]